MNNSEKIRTALIFGGAGYEHDISVKSAEHLLQELRGGELDIIPVFIEKDGSFYISEQKNASAETIASGKAALRSAFPTKISGKSGLITDGGFIPIDAAIPLLHGDFGEDGKIQGLLELADIPFVGCDTVCGAVSSDKAYSKLVAESVGVPTVRGISLTPASSIDSAISDSESTLGYPVFVKPTRLGSSVGASVAHNRKELTASLRSALSLGAGYTVIEEYVCCARELECAFFEHKSKQYFTNIGEIRCKDGFYDYENKYSQISHAEIYTVADIPKEMADRIREYSARIVNSLGCRDLSRIDFFLSQDGRLYFNEINTMPGLTSTSMFPRLAADIGFPLSELFAGFTRAALRRCGC